MNNSGTTSNIFANNSSTDPTNAFIAPPLTRNQTIGIITAAVAIFLAFIVFLGLCIYQKNKMKIQKKHAHSLTSNNPCYVSGPINELESSNSHAHCNMSVQMDFYDIDDLNSLDNDSFLNSLENAIFVGYMNHNRPNFSVDHSLSRISSGSTVHNNQAIFSREQRNRVACSSNSSKHSSGQTNNRSSVQLRSRKSKRSVNVIDSNIDHTRPRIQSETGCEITRSTSNLISSKMCLTASTDSVCDSSRGSNQIAEAANQCKLEEQISRETNIDNKTESSTDSRTSVNSSSAMMPSYLADTNAPSHALPDLVNSSLPKSAKHHKRGSSAYSNMVTKDDYVFSTTPRSGQILDPLRAGRTFQPESTQQSKHERHLSHSFGISNVGVFDFNMSS